MQRLDQYHQLERGRLHLLLIADTSKGLADVAADTVNEVRIAIAASCAAPAEHELTVNFGSDLDEIEAFLQAAEAR